MEKLSIVIPCYNSEKSLSCIVNKCIETINKDNRFDYEIILINDGSKDGTWDVIQELVAKFPKIIALNFAKNFGQHNALIAGYRNVSGDYIVGLDDDGEHNPEDIFKLLDSLIKNDYDYVCGFYESGKKNSLFRNFGSNMNAIMTKTLLDKPDDVIFSSFYVEKRFVTDQIAKCPNPFPYIMGLLLQTTRNFGMVPLEKHERLYGASGYSLKKLLSLWLNGFTAFSVKPLRVATVTGVFVAICGFLFGLFVIIKKIVNPQILLGYSSIMAVLLFVSGMIMIMLGLIGEYIGRIYININNMPQYVIKEKLSEQNLNNE